MVIRRPVTPASHTGFLPEPGDVDTDCINSSKMEKELLSNAELLTDPLPNLQQVNKVSF